jgi:cell volume regulation protein A
VPDTTAFAQLVLVVSLTAVVAVLSNRLSALVRVPAPLFFLAGAAVAVAAVPRLSAPPEQTVERLVAVCLLCILFDGGMQIGRDRFRPAAIPILTVGVAGTFLTTAGVMLLAHVAFGLSWYAAVLLGAVLAPTDPAVVFSVLSQREITGRAGTILEGESGANDPVGIALVASLLSAGKLTGGSVGHVVGEFALQMGVGAALGVAGGLGLLWFMRRVALPSEGLYPLRTLAVAFALYAVVALLHGSGFLAVFVAGIVIGDERAPFKREVKRFHSALASLAEIAAFVVLGLTVTLRDLVRIDVWVPAVIIAVALSAVIRPVSVGLCLARAKLRRNETAFVLFAGLKGAVPLLLGTTLLAARVDSPTRLYSIVVSVVALSVLVQGSLVPAVAGWLRLPMRLLAPQPWALGVRLTSEPTDVLRTSIGPGSAAIGRSIRELGHTGPELDDIWVHLVVRDGELLSNRGDTILAAGDELVVSADPTSHSRIVSLVADPSAHD